ncbi:hypothetical protein G7Z17_g1172 [Cylindrodendrum hubeiense]|uniref:Uncharacterized protein n=1 Tax=Cylindrodendrum hubeiense TaxID=595255 RepID=A0A9P5HJY9_9HYPO|nr:hypothetical protein G7Z17_g1172 [Cylindrodendrum hubeiense]
MQRPRSSATSRSYLSIDNPTLAAPSSHRPGELAAVLRTLVLRGRGEGDDETRTAAQFVNASADASEQRRTKKTLVMSDGTGNADYVPQRLQHGDPQGWHRFHDCFSLDVAALATLQPQPAPADAMAKLVHHACHQKSNIAAVRAIGVVARRDRLGNAMQSRWLMCIAARRSLAGPLYSQAARWSWSRNRAKPPRQRPRIGRNPAAVVLVLTSGFSDWNWAYEYVPRRLVPTRPAAKLAR